MDFIQADLIQSAPSPVLPPPPSPYPTIKESVGILGWYLLVTLLVGVPLFLIFDKALSLSRQMTNTLLVVIVNTALILFLRRKAGNRRQPLRLRGNAPGWLYLLLPVLVVAVGVVLSLLSYLQLPNWNKGSLQQMFQQPWLGFAAVCLAAPVLEEVLFRGVILNGLLRTQRPGIAIGISALLFGLVHANPAQTVNAAILGGLMGWLYYRTQSLGLSMLFHVLFNALAAGSTLWNQANQVTADEQPFGSLGIYAVLVVVSAGAVGVMLWKVGQIPVPAAAWLPSALPAARHPEPEMVADHLAEALGSLESPIAVVEE